MADTPGKRLYLIRLALGDGVKNPMRIDDFVSLVRKVCKVTYDPSAISRAENGDRKLSIEDVPHFAAVDPERRGRDWLAWGEERILDLSHAKPVSASGKARALPIADREREKGAPRKRTRKRRLGGGSGAA